MGRRWSLRIRFVLIATACLLPLLAVVLYVLFESFDNGRDQLLEAQNRTAEIVAQSVGATLQDNQAVLDELARTDAVRWLDAEVAGETLRGFKLARPNLFGLFLVDPGGHVVASAGLDPMQLSVPPSSLPAVERALAGLGEFVVSNRLAAPEEGDDVIALLAPVVAEEQDPAKGQPVGAVGGLLSVEKLRDTVFPFARGDTAIAIVAEGEIIAAQPAELVASDLTQRLAAPIANAVAGSVDSLMFRDADGTDRQAAYAPIPIEGVDWAVFVTNPSPTTYAPNRLLRNNALAALLLAVVATLVLAVGLGERVARPLRLLTARAVALVPGEGNERPPPGGEIAALGTAVNRLADRLATEAGDLAAARREGAAQAERLRDLHRRTLRLQEDERRRLAAEIHDAVAPLITGALYQTRALRLADDNGAAHSYEHSSGTDPRRQVAAELDGVDDLLTRAMEELHGVIFALRPPDLDDLGVVAAIERYVAQVQRSGLNCRLEVVGEAPTLTPEVRLAVYRIVQEALHNALRHAAADEAVVRLEAANGVLRVTIQDNGAGFDPAHPARPAALGLLSMRERAAAIGATFAVTSRPGDGTTVVFERRMELEPDAAPEPTAVVDEAAAAVVTPRRAPLVSRPAEVVSA